MYIKGPVTIVASGGSDTPIAEIGMVVVMVVVMVEPAVMVFGASGDGGQWWSRWTGRGAISVGGARGRDAGW